jgi:Zn-dependent peptidase ImmA (M78 family)
MQRIASALGVRAALFLRDLPQETSQYYFRSTASVTLSLQKKARARLRWAEVLVDELREWIDFPDVNFPTIDVPPLASITDEFIGNAAAKCREHWSLGNGPIPDVIGVLENAGSVVIREELGGVKMDGVSVWSGADNRPFVLLADDKASAVRSRFDAAHELGHLVLHRNLKSEELKPVEYAELERQAHRFASAFLLPEEGFVKDVDRLDLDHLVSLKPKWRVSIAAMIMRCHQLEWIADSYKEKLFKYLSARGWRRAEPLDDSLTPERPTTLSSAIQLVIESGKYTRVGFCEQVGLESADIEALSSLAKGYLTKEAAPVVRLRDFVQNGNVVPLSVRNP